MDRQDRHHDKPCLAHRCAMELRGHGERDGIPTVYSGEMLRVRLRLRFDAPGTLGGIRVKLLYRANGSGSPESHELERRTMRQGDVAAGDELEGTYLFSVPESGPMSYEGVYVKIHWAVGVELLGVAGEHFEHLRPLLVLPRPVEWISEAPPDWTAEDPRLDLDAAVKRPQVAKRVDDGGETESGPGEPAGDSILPTRSG